MNAIEACLPCEILISKHASHDKKKTYRRAPLTRVSVSRHSNVIELKLRNLQQHENCVHTRNLMKTYFNLKEAT